MIELQPPDWWEQLPVLKGAALQVREVHAQDVDALFELLTDPRVSQYISPPPPSAQAFGGFIEWAHRQRKAGACVCFAVVPDGLKQAIGLFQVRALEPTFKVAEWGFAIGAAFWSTGVFEEAAGLIAQFAFSEMGVHRLEARAVVENGRGNRALEKLGATGEAVLRRAFGRKSSQFLWSILAEDWRAGSPERARGNTFNAAELKLQIARAIKQLPTPVKAKSPARPQDPFPFFLTDSSDDPSEDC